ncbi:hypothetical protein MYX64_08455 [Nitrospinae bacterium AH_259_B05_G02_I21]|nr:hypothetical protein [Nitrospinae bacterium AH_259_B05_G02_I21]MDA2932418.1 hypothetical protein [Nitrospinae bacterium AH-259-F20]
MRQTSTVPTNLQPTVVSPRVIVPPRPAVSQATLAEILKRRREVKEAEKSLKAQKDALADREWAVIQALEKGATVALGVLTASINHETRRNVKWREVAEQYLGAEFCQTVIDETEPTIYPRLVIA